MLSNVQAAEAAGHECIKSSLWNFIQTGLDQVKQSTEPYQLNVKCDISSLGKVLTKRNWGICTGVSERLDRVRPDV